METTVTIENCIIHPEDYRDAIISGDEFYIQFHMFKPDVESQLNKIIHRFLGNHDLIYLKETILVVVKELINNAIKANIKRIYFKLNELNLENPEEYRKGMETFKEDTFLETENEYFHSLNKSKLVVRITFKSTDKHLHINIINNIPILESELNKVNQRVKKAYKYSDISEAFEDVLDDSEGAGLGLIMAMMLFKNAGLPSEAFKVYTKNELTISSISIPNSKKEIKTAKKVANEIIKEIESVPAFPENIREIQRLCNTPDISMKQVADGIALDPGVTTSILKLANSAGYITAKKVDSIEEAAKIIGLKGINMLLVAAGVHNVIGVRYKRFEATWRDSYRRAFYAQRISVQLKKVKITEFAYLAGLLADLGRIIMLSLNPDVLSKLRVIAGGKGLEDNTLIEEISLGLSHSTLGGMICKKWKFNDALIKTIDYHHRPHMAPENLKQLVFIVYLADSMVEIENKKMRFETIDEDVLEYFNLSDIKAFNKIHSILNESYTTELEA